MRIKIVIYGLCALLAIPSYTIVPSLITTTMSKFSGGNSPSLMASQIFSQLGIPPIDTIIKLIQYSLIGLAVAGLFITVFGVIAKKTPKKSTVTLSINSNQKMQDQESINLRAIHLLQERLAKGEITSTQYMSLKNVLEDKI